MAKSVIPSTIRLSFKEHPKRTVFLAVIVLLVISGGVVYFIRAHQAATANAEPAFQTATVRQGELVISASGTGTLTPAEEIELGFTEGGKVTGLFVKAGDQVEAGELLAEVDSSEAQLEYTDAKHTYQELTSDTAIASAQEAVAQAQANLMSAKYDLEYLISPDVLYWETEITKGKQTLTEAKASVEANPSDEEAQRALSKAEDYLDCAQDKLKEAWMLYDDEYVPETFRAAEYPNGTDYYIVPTDLEIKLARTAIDEAQKKLDDSQAYYKVLMGAPMPEDASSDALVELQQAERNLQAAKATLDGTKIFSPISGTVMEVNATIGNTIDTGTAIVLADLTQLEVEIYLDESDWDKVVTGNIAEITFESLPNQVFEGVVTEVDTELYVSFNTSTVRGIVSLDSSKDKVDLPLGASATVEVISARAENALLVPVDALHETGPGEYSVYVIENGEPTLRKIEIGLQDQIYAEIKSGLPQGATVVTGSITTN